MVILKLADGKSITLFVKEPFVKTIGVAGYFEESFSVRFIKELYNGEFQGTMSC